MNLMKNPKIGIIIQLSDVSFTAFFKIRARLKPFGQKGHGGTRRCAEVLRVLREPVVQNLFKRALHVFVLFTEVITRL